VPRNYSLCGFGNDRTEAGRLAKTYRSKSVWTLFQRKLLNNQTVWPVIFGFTGPICARALKSFHLLELRPRRHHDWPVKPTIRELKCVVAPLDILVEALYRRLECLLKNKENASGYCKARWIF